jgi:streptomycin 6-kinase
VKLRQQFGGYGPFPQHLVERASAIYAELAASSETPLLQHGDFHHTNILSAERDPWLAIDPKGVVGPPGYDVGPYVLNRLPDARSEPDAAAAITHRRIRQFSAELGLEPALLTRCALAHSVLSAWWTYEDHGYPGGEALALAALLVRLEEAW